MSKPVKVSTTLYESLQQDASRLGMTIQDALARRLADSQAEANRLSALSDKQKRLLRAKESELTAARSARKTSASRISVLEAQVKEAQQAVSCLESEREELEETVSELESEADERDETLEREKGEREQREGAYKTALFLLGVAALIGTGVYFWRKTRKQPDGVAVNQQVNQAPGFPTAGRR